MSFPDKNSSWEPRVPSTEKNMNKRQGHGAYERRLEKRRIYKSRQFDAERINSLVRKYDLSTDELVEPAGDDDVVLSYHDEVVAHFVMGDEDDYEIPEGVVETTDFHVCYHLSDVSYPDQLDGIFDPEPWRFRSNSLGSDCSILDIRERLDEDVDVEMQDYLPVEKSPSDEVIAPSVCPSTSAASVCERSCSILQPGSPPHVDVVNLETTSIKMEDDEPSYTAVSPVYIYGLSDDVREGPLHQPSSPISISTLRAEVISVSTTASETLKHKELSSPLRVRLRSGKTLGLTRKHPAFRVGWKGSTIELRHRKCYVSEKSLSTDVPIKVILTKDCCWDVSTGKFPDALHIAVVGEKTLGSACDH